jgi:hypothetical protein
MSIHEGKNLECKKCGKYYDDLDHLVYHILKEHPGIFRATKFKTGAKFLFDNGYVFVYHEDEEEYALEVKHTS